MLHFSLAPTYFTLNFDGPQIFLSSYNFDPHNILHKLGWHYKMGQAGRYFVCSIWSLLQITVIDYIENYERLEFKTMSKSQVRGWTFYHSIMAGEG